MLMEAVLKANGKRIRDMGKAHTLKVGLNQWLQGFGMGKIL